MSPILYRHKNPPITSCSCPVGSGNGEWDDFHHPFDNVQADSNTILTVTQTLILTPTNLRITTVTASPVQTVTTTVTASPPARTATTTTVRLILDKESTTSGSSSYPGSTLSSPSNSVSTSLSPLSSTLVITSNTSLATAPTIATSLPSRKPSTIPVITSATALPYQSDETTISTGAVVGITLASVLFFLLLIICFIRQRFRRKMVDDRTSVTPFVQEKPTLRPSVNKRQQKRMEYLAERWGRIRSLQNLERLGESSRGVTARSSATTRADKYYKLEDHGRSTKRRNRDNALATRTNPSIRPPPIAHREPSARRPASDTPHISSLLKYGAVARLEFTPSRPDELLVSPGDSLRVIALYDDGWAYCRNNYGEKGMVPTLCLRVNEVRRMG